MILFLLGRHHSPSSSSVPRLASSSAFSPSGSLSHDEKCSSSSSMLLAHLYGQLNRCALALRSRSSIGFHSCHCLCPVACPFAPIASLSFVAVPIRFAALGALFASFLGSVISPATRPFISAFSTMPCSRIRPVPFCLLLCRPCTPSKR